MEHKEPNPTLTANTANSISSALHFDDIDKASAKRVYKQLLQKLLLEPSRCHVVDMESTISNLVRSVTSSNSEDSSLNSIDHSRDKTSVLENKTQR